MFEVNIAAVLLVSLIVMVMLGVHIAVALGVASALGVYLVTGNFAVVERMLASTAYEALRDYVFAVIPLFMLMGEFIARSGAVTDIYKGINRGLRRIPGRLALATVLGNALFSLVTGVSIASAAAFSRVSYPEMKRHGYQRTFALGSIAGSSCLGMLIPPSVLMIVWGILTEKSIGALFLAGVVPGLMVAGLFCLYILGAAILKPELVGAGRGPAAGTAAGGASAAPEPPPAEASEPVDRLSLWTSILGIVLVVVTVLGGIWFGFFTPTEGAGAGAFIALVLAIVKGLRFREIIDCVLAVGRTSAPILILLVMASLYARTLAMTGVTNAIQDAFLGAGLTPALILLIMIGIWFVLGMFIDSISIMLLTVIIFEPIAVSVGFDSIAFAVIGVLAIEAGLLTPPFGLLVYTVKAAIDDKDISIWSIFWSSTPYWVVLLIAVVLVALFPGIATYLPKLMFGTP
ncbi:MAG TPA: TRAP transporter large permease subunit [Burkholderiales bacterium]|nr:TRAP transporter large permease subunit [Burkholderiales bacterium]